MPDKAVVHETGRHYADGPIPEVEPTGSSASVASASRAGATANEDGRYLFALAVQNPLRQQMHSSRP